MDAVFVIGKNGERLMPTHRLGHVRHLLKDGKAHIYSRNPFTIQMDVETTSYVQPMEIGVDAGYEHIGISIKSESRECVAAQYDLLKDEKQRHDDCRRYRRTRRNHLRYRKPRWNNRKATKKEGWIAPSLQHKAEAHISLIEKFCEVAPITRVTVEVGQFDPTLLRAMELGEKLPEGTDYQHGELYYADSLRQAVFQRDNYTCRVCKRSALKNKNIILHEHHHLYWKGRHADTLHDLITVCTDCHTSANHQPGGKLWGMEFKVPRLEGATYLNIVRWEIINTLREDLQDVDVCHCYGAETSRKRKDRNIEKSHINDAYCIGQYMPEERASTEYYSKRRRNNRILEKFYDSKLIDLRTGKVVKGAQLGCERTNRKESRSSEKTLRIYRGATVSKGQRSIRRQHYTVQPGDIISLDGKMYTAKGTQNCGNYIAVNGRSPISAAKLKIICHAGAWLKGQPA